MLEYGGRCGVNIINFVHHKAYVAMLDENVDDIRGDNPVIECENGTKLSGPLLVAAITSVCSSGFLLFGFDQG